LRVFEPELGDASLADGVQVPRGSTLTSRAGKAGTTACEFRTAHAMTLWPLELTQAEYFTHASDLPIVGLPELRKYRAGLRIRLRTTAGLDFSRLALQDLRLHFSGVDEIAYRLNELVCDATLGVMVQPAARGTGRFEALAGDCVAAVGFEDDEALLPQGLRGFEGYRLLQEYFAFPQRFLFFDCRTWDRRCASWVDKSLKSSSCSHAATPPCSRPWTPTACRCIACRPSTWWNAAATASMSAPRPMTTRSCPTARGHMDFEVHSILDVQGFGVGVDSEWRFLPFYSAFHTEDRSHSAYYSVQREPRLLSSRSAA
jgi:type VI secretion system protein ImpG